MAVANACDRQAQKLALIEALNEHRINTLSELRRVERIFATLGSSDLTQPMTAACTIQFLLGHALGVRDGHELIRNRDVLRELKQSPRRNQDSNSTLPLQVCLVLLPQYYIPPLTPSE